MSGNAALADDTIQFTVQSPPISNIPRAPIFINVSGGNNANAIAARVVDAVNNLNLSGVSANIASASAASATVSLISQTSDKVTWSDSVLKNAVNSKVSVVRSPAPVQPAAGTPAGQPAAAVAPTK